MPICNGSINPSHYLTLSEPLFFRVSVSRRPLVTNLFCKWNAMTLQLQNSLYLQREYSLSSFIMRHTVLFSSFSLDSFNLSSSHSAHNKDWDFLSENTRVHWLVQTFSRSAYLHETQSWSWPHKWDVIGRTDEWLIKSVESKGFYLNLQGGNFLCMRLARYISVVLLNSKQDVRLRPKIGTKIFLYASTLKTHQLRSIAFFYQRCWRSVFCCCLHSCSLP